MLEGSPCRAAAMAVSSSSLLLAPSLSSLAPSDELSVTTDTCRERLCRAAPRCSGVPASSGPLCCNLPADGLCDRRTDRRRGPLEGLEPAKAQTQCQGVSFTSCECSQYRSLHCA